ncbi:MAG: hypothetical protein NUV98_02765 [Candidatus Roizmanbacteria bacterium]|nr:hypothetical protein [Candidatus Roizmanbacteria bacterium]
MAGMLYEREAGLTARELSGNQPLLEVYTKAMSSGDSDMIRLIQTSIALANELANNPDALESLQDEGIIKPL